MTWRGIEIPWKGLPPRLHFFPIHISFYLIIVLWAQTRGYLCHFQVQIDYVNESLVESITTTMMVIDKCFSNGVVVMQW